jgi:hypothetical protein
MMAGEMPRPTAATIPAFRVDASRHSRACFNAFSIDTANVDVIESVPLRQRQPQPCCSPLCSTMCAQDGEDGSFRQRIELDPRTKTLLVGAGFTFKEIKTVLAPADLMLKGTPDADSISLGGAIATGAHGGGLTSQPCSAYILDLWIVNAQGVEVHVNRRDPDFSAAVVSLGLLGPITNVRIQCFTAMNNRKQTGTTMATYSGAELGGANPNTTFFRYAMYKKRMVRFDETATDDPTSTSGCGGLLDTAAESQCLTHAIDHSIGCFPWLAYIISQHSASPSMKVFDRLDFVSRIPSAPILAIEYAVDIADAAACFDELTVLSLSPCASPREPPRDARRAQAPWVEGGWATPGVAQHSARSHFSPGPLADQAAIDSNRKEGRLISYQFFSRFVGAVDDSWVLALSAGMRRMNSVACCSPLSACACGLDRPVPPSFVIPSLPSPFALNSHRPCAHTCTPQAPTRSPSNSRSQRIRGVLPPSSPRSWKYFKSTTAARTLARPSGLRMWHTQLRWVIT